MGAWVRHCRRHVHRPPGERLHLLWGGVLACARRRSTHNGLAGFSTILRGSGWARLRCTTAATPTGDRNACRHPGMNLASNCLLTTLQSATGSAAAATSHPSCTGNNELDQIQKIHAITGAPPPELLAKLKKRSTHSSCFDFPPTEGSGLAKLLSHVPPDCADLIAKLLAYNPDERLSARQALRHPYFRSALLCMAVRLPA